MKSKKIQIIEERKQRLERAIESSSGDVKGVQALGLLRDRCVKLLEVLNGEKEEQA